MTGSRRERDDRHSARSSQKLIELLSHSDGRCVQLLLQVPVIGTVKNLLDQRFCSFSRVFSGGGVRPRPACDQKGSMVRRPGKPWGFAQAFYRFCVPDERLL